MEADRSDKTAFITGASSGLGAEFARQLAARGYNLLLTARRENRLQELASQIRSAVPIEVEIHPADLSRLQDIESLVSIISARPNLSILVNNAGFGTVGRFDRVATAKELNMLNVHMVAPVLLTRAALPGMLERDHGGIINVSSLAGLIPLRNVVYHSSKAFMISFSEILRVELAGTHIQVQALCPGYMETEFHSTPEYTQFSRESVPKILWTTPTRVVSESLDSLSRGRLICAPGRINRLAAAFARNSFSAGLMKFFAQILVIRRKAL